MEKRAVDLLQNLEKRNIQGFYCVDKSAAVDKILEMIPATSSIGASGSQTLEQLGIIERLAGRGNKVISHIKPGISQKESLELRRQATLADYYLASANAVSVKGELVFFSAYGNRISGISYANKAIVICGINKLTANISDALKRAREYAAPLNCKRLNWNTPCFQNGICREDICLFPGYKRMCCQQLIIEAEAIPDRLKVILVGENLGF